MQLIQAGVVLLSVCSALIAAEPNISCDINLPYVGNCISNEYVLKISGPETKTWLYQITLGNLCDPRFDKSTRFGVAFDCKESYEFADDLVLLTGTTTFNNKQQRQKIGLNYMILDGHPTFNNFFRNANGELLYHYKSFQLIDNQWLPETELKLKILNLPEKYQREWELKCQGTRSRWHMKQVIQEKIELSQHYTLVKEDYYRAEKPAVGESAWLTEGVSIQRSKETLEAVHLLRSPSQLSGFTFPLEVPKK